MKGMVKLMNADCFYVIPGKEHDLKALWKLAREIHNVDGEFEPYSIVLVTKDVVCYGTYDDMFIRSKYRRKINVKAGSLGLVAYGKYYHFFEVSAEPLFCRKPQEVTIYTFPDFYDGGKFPRSMPEIEVPKLVLYVHGLNGHENGSASKLVKEALKEKGIKAIVDAPRFRVTDPAKMQELLTKEIEAHDIVIASSLGAFYTMQQKGKPKILINPALPENIEKLNDKGVTPELLQELESQKAQFFANLDDDVKAETTFIFGDQDTLAPNSQFFESQYQQPDKAFHVDMGHKVDEIGAAKVAEIVAGLKSKQ